MASIPVHHTVDGGSNWVAFPLAALEVSSRISLESTPCTAWVYLVVFCNYHSYIRQKKGIPPLTRHKLSELSHGSYGVESIRKSLEFLLNKEYIQRISKSTYSVDNDSFLQVVESTRHTVKTRPPHTRKVKERSREPDT